MTKKKSKQAPPPKSSFVKRTYEGGRDFAIKHGMTGIITLLISSVIPMLEQWHSDKMYKDEITAVGNDNSQQIKDLEDRMNKKIDDLKIDDNDKIKQLWISLGNKQDKKINKDFE